MASFWTRIRRLGDRDRNAGRPAGEFAVGVVVVPGPERVGADPAVGDEGDRLGGHGRLPVGPGPSWSLDLYVEDVVGGRRRRGPGDGEGRARSAGQRERSNRHVDGPGERGVELVLVLVGACGDEGERI